MATIKINGKPYHVRFKLRTMAAFEKRTGITANGMSSESMSIENMVIFAHCAISEGMRKNGTPLKENEDVEWLMDAIEDDESLIEKIFGNFATVTKVAAGEKKN